MKLIFPVLLVFILTGCVQQAHLKTVMVTLKIRNQKNIEAVAIRGNGNPLSWESDYPMIPVIKDSLYSASFKTMTAFKFTEIKFIVDNVWELEGKPNRKVFYEDHQDTVFINAVYNHL